MTTTYSNLANKWREEDDLAKQLEAYRKARTSRERREILAMVASVVSIRHKTMNRDGDHYEDDDDISEASPSLDDLYPAHGKRGTYGPPDSDGWRLVTRKSRKQKRELTEAELAQKYRDVFENSDDGSAEGDVNGDLTDRNQRRDFY